MADNRDYEATGAETGAETRASADMTEVREQIASRARSAGDDEARPGRRGVPPEGHAYAPPSTAEAHRLLMGGADGDDDAAEGWTDRGGFFRGPRTRDMALFCRQLGTLLDVGLPLIQALRTLAERTTHPRLKHVVADIAARVEEGATFSSALRRHPRVFSHLLISVVEIGELGGILENSIRRLADLLERKQALQKKTRAALMYPCVALALCFFVVVMILYLAVPQFETIYARLNAPLPGPTQALITASDFMRTSPHLYLPVLVATAVALWLAVRSRPGRRVYDWLTLKMWALGPIATKIHVARFSRAVGSLVMAGIPLLEALHVTARTTENVWIARKLRQVHDALERGDRMETPLREDTIIPPIAVDMMVIGYEAGALEEMFLRIADNYDADVDETLKGLASIIEPVLIIVLALLVGFMLFAIMLPYFNLATLIV